MAHEIDMTNGRANMAFVGKLPWHGLGSKINPDASIEEWRMTAGLDWEIQRAPVQYQINGSPTPHGFDGREVLYRSDTKAPLSVVSGGYKEVQPAQILEFFRDLVQRQGFTMHTAGSLKGGRKIWALAEIDKHAEVVKGDRLDGYLLLATSCDGSMPTTARYTSVRVLCNNTLELSVNQNARKGKEAKIYHFSTFDADNVKLDLGLAAETWTAFIARAKALAKIKLSDKKAVTILQSVFARTEEDRTAMPDDYIKNNTAPRVILELFQGKAIGFDLAGSTGWGLVNATTQYLDHEKRSRTGNEGRIEHSWFRVGADQKRAVMDECLKLAA